jgi:hypothetical protein
MYIGQCTQTTSYKPPFSSAERHITEQDASKIFVILCGPSRWQPIIRFNMQGHFKDLPAQRPIRIVTDGEFAGKYKAIFSTPAGADAQGFVDRRNATIYLKEFPAGNQGGSLVGLALHEAVHLFSHAPGKSNQLRSTAFSFLGVGLLEGLTQVVTEDIQTTQGITPLPDRWQAYKEYTPVARQFIRVFTTAVVGDAYFGGNLTRLLRAIEQRWTFEGFQNLKNLTNKKETEKALRLIGSMETAYHKRPRIRESQWVFR